jgi:four helix bundle protein
MGRRHAVCAWEEGMTHSTPPGSTSFPHSSLIGYQLALELVKLVAKTRIADAQLRQQARRSAASAALNTAEGAARQTLADKARAYSIAFAECCECCAAIEIASALGAVSPSDETAIRTLGLRLKNVLSRLAR